ncbi:MAG: Gfo/Idh/MocA family oxidoreductase [Clostridia bacterium]|nr:Gfo/Idh/MocA family oxidoreductase [Clostridia bacterium]
MNRLNLAIIGQGRSGKGIHGVFYRSDNNRLFTVKYVVEQDAYRGNLAKELYPGCTVLSDYKELFAKTDIDLVVNATFSEMHFAITEDLLEHGLNVLVEKPFARNRFECDTLIRLAEQKGVTLAVFQQTFYSPIYMKAIEVLQSGVLGKPEQISIRYNGFSRRWDWQTLQKRLGGGLYNNGPHPIGLGLGFIDFDPAVRVVYSKTDSTDLTSGDGDDYAKVLFTAPGKPLVDVEVNSTDAYPTHTIKIQGTKGTYVSSQSEYKYTYIIDGENHERPVVEGSLKKENGDPVFCSEQLIKHEVTGKFDGTPFDMGVSNLYEDLYYAITEGREMMITPKKVKEIIGIVESVHAQNPLPRKF